MNQFGSLRSSWLMTTATIITITIVAASQLVTDRIRLLLNQQASELQAADLVIASSKQFDEAYPDYARRMDLSIARTTSLRTAVFVDGKPRLVELKAVSELYPLRGKLEISRGLTEQIETVSTGPVSGEVWVDSKLADLVGQKIDLGEGSYDSSRLIKYEPDRGGALFNLAPRVMMNIDDLDATGLIVDGSRVRYQLLFSGSPQKIEELQALLTPLLKEGEELRDVSNSRPEMRRALDRTQKFFSLSIVLTLIIAMVAIAITARYSAAREAPRVAVLRAFGISRGRLFRFYAASLGKIWLIATVIGLAIGWVVQMPLEWILDGWFGRELPADFSTLPFINAAVVGLISLVGFSVPNLLDVIATPPMQVFRPVDRPESLRRRLMLSGISLMTVFVVLLILMQSSKLVLAVLVVVLVSAIVLPLIFKILIESMLKGSGNKFWLRQYLLSRLRSNARAATFVMSGFSLALISILLIAVVKDELLSDWQTQLPDNIPNYFLINIETEDAPEIEALFEARNIVYTQAFPLVRTRLTHINDSPVEDIQFLHPRGNHLANRTFNVSYAESIPDDNVIVEGNWHSSSDQSNSFSVEEGMADKLNLKLGDSLKFSVGSTIVEGEVSSIRTVAWENFKPNFYLLGTRSMLEDLPQTWLMSALIEGENSTVLKNLVQEFPSVTLLDISAMMERVRGIVSRATLALEFFFAFALASSLIVLLAAIQTGKAERQLESSLLRALSATTRQLYAMHVLEFSVMGLLIGVFSALVASFAGWGISHFFFDMEYQFSSQVWVLSVLSSVSVLTIAGVLVSQRVYSVSPMQVLRS